jgi:hypothetical protein
MPKRQALDTRLAESQAKKKPAPHSEPARNC